MNNDDLNIEELDPGIRNDVLKLRQNGFCTSDSGDGVSKPFNQRIFNCPHIVAKVSKILDFIHEAHRMQNLLGEGWEVEATYSTRDKTQILIALKGQIQLNT